MIAFWEQIRWRPGIGDPGIIAWLTVVAYFTVAGLCLLRARRDPGRFWRTAAGLLIFFGINKELDLQSLLTDIGRVLAHNWNFYHQRRIVQWSFIGFIGIAGAAGLAWVWPRVAGDASKRLTLIGFVSLFCFVMIRASSLHAVDGILGIFLFNIAKVNWVIELSCLSLIAAGCVRNLRR